MIIEYRVTPKSQKENYSLIFLIAVGLLPGIFLIVAKGVNNLSINIAIYGFIIVTILQSLPLYFLNINYLKASKNDQLNTDIDNKNIVYIHDGAEIRFNVSDIKSIRHYSSFPYKNGFPGKLSWDRYNYMYILLTDGRALIITSLLVPKMKEFIDNMDIDKDKIKKIGSFYSSIISIEDEKEYGKYGLNDEAL